MLIFVKHFRTKNNLFRIRVDKVNYQFVILPGVGAVWGNKEWIGISFVWMFWGIAFEVRKKEVQNDG